MAGKNRHRNKTKKRNGGIGNSLKNSRTGRVVAAATNATIVPDEFSPKGESHFEIPVIRKEQKRIISYSGEMTVAQLAALTNVDNYDSAKTGEQGYQRNRIEKRGRDFGYFMSDPENTCLGEIMLNDRDAKAEFISVTDLVPDVPRRKCTAVCGILRIPGDAVFYAFDGQTRRFGYIALLHYELAMKEKGENFDFQHMKVPFCLSQETYVEEISRFLDHNGRMAKVSNTHRAMVVFNANCDSIVIKNQTPAEKIYTISAGIIRELNDSRTSPWHGMIKMPDTSAEEEKKLITTMASFNTGMKGLLAWMNKEYWSPETSLEEKRNDMVAIVTTFWRAVKQVCPKIWRTPEKYVMHKAQGVASLLILMERLYKDFFNLDSAWNITNIVKPLKKSGILTSPKLWEVDGKLSKRGGSYKQLERLADDIYLQIRKSM